MTTTTQRFSGLDMEKRGDPWLTELDTIRHEFEERIAQLLADSGDNADLLARAMRAGTLGAGKRMRPLLLMLVARDLGCSSPALVDIACAVEMVHAASLILDDMPCMDNAMLRRGQPTIHVQFGEDVAILASVALLSRAFGILATAPEIPPLVRARLVAKLAETVGAQGLVRGQFEDLRGGGQRTAEEIATTNELKTGVLLGVSVDMAAIVAESDECVAQSLRAFALAAGHAFQIRDDFQDGPGNDSAVTGKDTGKDLGKATLINALGLEEARQRLATHLDDADRYLTDAIGSKQGTRRFVDTLFARGPGLSGLRLAVAQGERQVHH
ncbi:polyprenyl synthetase family protein [Massilia niabensis]|uniref:Polyprenyl synthetase family protein n=1 Tax=Massilia niabensis TaxID=544910 RepID=A0ABW0L9G7_9BURK